MTTPQRSRYPRPLKAMHTFSSGNGSGQGPLLGTTTSQAIAANSTSNGPTANSGPPAANGQTPPVPKSGYSSPPPLGGAGGGGGGGRRTSPERRSPVAANNVSSRGEGVGISYQYEGYTDLNPRRSSSMGSLSDPDYYMNSVWPRITTIQCDGEDPLVSDDTEFNFFHKRSNSYSGVDHLKPAGLRGGTIPSAHTRTSIEGLNQEVSSVLEGNPILLVQATPPDGHVAPIRDLLGSTTIGVQTPPLGPGGGATTSHHTYFPLSPSSSSHTVTSETTPITSESIQSGTNTSSKENHTSFQHPLSPKPSFAREPPDGAERCISKIETSIYGDGFVPLGPDKSKGNITFKGTAFVPPLVATPSINLQPVV